MSKKVCDCGYDRGDGIEYVCYQCDACKTFIAKREYDGDQLRAEIERLKDRIETLQHPAQNGEWQIQSLQEAHSRESILKEQHIAQLIAENQKLRESMNAWRQLAYTSREWIHDASRYFGGNGERELEKLFAELEQKESEASDGE